ncbi:hypothetical protein vseg_020981 [Gypsophila vaccaria]
MGNEDYVNLSSRVRAGHKREFQFALQSQSEFSASLTRLRARKRVADSPSQERVAVAESESDSAAEEEEESDVVDLTCDDGSVVVESDRERGRECVPSKFKELLETGLLEGLNVRYIRGTKIGQTGKGLAGVIKGVGILCYCDHCKGVQIVTPTQFELHAGSASKRPADYTHLENGNTIRDVLDACKGVKLTDVTAAIRDAISSSPGKKSACCRNCREPISDASMDKMTMLCDSCSKLNVSHKTPKQTAENEDRSVQPLSRQRACNAVPKSNSLSTKSQGKITRKDLRLHKLVFQDDVLPDGTELGYYAQGKKLLSGFKKASGICCSCCDSVVSPSQFESHAGYASRRKPYLQIYTSNGMSLHEISVKISKEHGFSTDENDDLCSICQGDGDLLCCDGCPRVFHLHCVSLPCIPEGKWYCKLCSENLQMEKFAERNANAIAAGRIPGVDPMEQITNRRIRIVTLLDTQQGGCALCRIQDFCRSGFGPQTVIICDQCEREYHVGCMKEHNMQDLKELPVGDWFCSSDCQRVNLALKELLEQGDQRLPDDLALVIKKKLADVDFNGDDPDIRWRVLHGRKSSLEENLPLLSKAVSVFHEQFDPILYGAYKQDLIPHMVYARNVKETEFGGMYCAELSVNSVIVSAGVFRVFSKDVAEIPLVATSNDCEGKGYFQCLYSCLERSLKDLGVKNLLIPSAEETKSLWINRFGFNMIPREELNKLTGVYPLMNFDGTSMLCKLITNSSTRASGDTV